MRSRPAVTLTTLARELGVNVSTVSRALSDHPVGVSAQTVEHVRSLARARGYVHNASARALRTGRSWAVGMTVPRLTDVVLALVYHGVDEVAIDAGYTAFVANTRDDAELRRRRLDLMLAHQVDGILLADTHLQDPHLDQLDAAGVPHVLALRSLPDRVSVSTDDRTGGRLAAQHLLALGHTRVAVAAGDLRASTGKERTAGFVETYAQAGHPVPASLVVAGMFDVDSGARAAHRLLDLAPDLTAVFATSDTSAVGVLGTLRDRGRSVPDDVAVVGYNNLDLGAALPVPLTSVDSRLTDIGRLAMSTLLELIDGRDPASQRLPPTLVVRASTTGVTLPT